jgi:hypothetical protein
MTRWLILGALLSSAAGCGTRYVAISPTASPSGGRLLTFSRGNGFAGWGYKLVLLDDGDLEYESSSVVDGPDWDEVPVAPAAMAKVRASLERLSALPSDCCNCGGPTDLSWVSMTFRPAGGAEVKKIDHYEGCNKTPEWVYDAENEIDAALETGRWLGHKVVGKPYH